MKRWTRSLAIRALCAAAFAAWLGSGGASAMPFGAFANDEAHLELTADGLIDAHDNQFWSSGPEAPVTSLPLHTQHFDLIGVDGNGVFYDPQDPTTPYYVTVYGAGSANARGSISNGALHASADALSQRTWQHARNPWAAISFFVRSAQAPPTCTRIGRIRSL